MDLIIDNEFRDLLPPLPEEKRKQLEENVLRDGIREPLTVWQGILIDGHNRYEIAQAHGLEFKTVEMQFANRDDVKYWMIMNQFGRRDLTTYERSVLALKLKPVIAAKAKEKQGERTDIPEISRESRAKRITAGIKAQNYPKMVEDILLGTVPRQVSAEIRNELRNAHTHVYFARIDDKMKVGVSATVEERIKQLKVSSPTIELVGDVLFGEGAYAHENKLKKKFASALISGEVYRYSDEVLKEMLTFTRREAERKNETNFQVAKAAGVSEDTIRKVEKIEAQASPEIKAALRTGDMSINQAYEGVKAGATTIEEVKETKKPHVYFNGGNNEWYTPAEFIEAARLTMGTIDLDPASSEIANETVKAAKFFTAEDDGLAQIWAGNIWMNPPYSSGLIEKFTGKLLESDYSQAIVLVNNSTDTEWFSRLTEKAAAVIFPKGRVKFLKPDGTPGAPLQGQAILYFGSNAEAFKQNFGRYGRCWQ